MENLGTEMYQGKGCVLWDQIQVLKVKYEYYSSRNNNHFEGMIAADMRGFERNFFFNPLVLRCQDGILIDMTITTIGDTVATFRGTISAEQMTGTLIKHERRHIA